MVLRKKGMIEMQNMLAQFCMNQLGFGPVGEIMMVTPGSGNAHNYFRDKINEANLFTSIQKAYAATISARNDVILVTPDMHSWYGDGGAITATLTWDKQNVHMLGLDAGGLSGYSRARFQHTSTNVNMLTMSGTGNMFKNVRITHGNPTAGSAGDITLMTLSGSGNTFDNVNFATPCSNAQAVTGYRGLIISGTQNYFKHCMIGTANDVSRAGANNALLKFATTCSAMHVFEDCIFRSRAEATTVIFIDDACTQTNQDFTGIFKNCQFINCASGGYSTLAVGITKAANAARQLFFDNRCTFAGVTAVVTTGQEASIIWGGGGASPDGSAALDNKHLGLSHIVCV